MDSLSMDPPLIHILVFGFKCRVVYAFKSVMVGNLNLLEGLKIIVETHNSKISFPKTSMHILILDWLYNFILT